MDVLDVEGLLSESRSAEDGEAFRTILRQSEYRVGVGARAPGTLFVEVLLDPFPDGQVDLEYLGWCLELLRSLQENGYTLSCAPGGGISSERIVEKEVMEKEVAAAMEWGRRPFIARV